jgi:hypothetical protein
LQIGTLEGSISDYWLKPPCALETSSADHRQKSA